MRRWASQALVWRETGLLYSSNNPHLSSRARNVSVAPRFLPQLRANATSLWAHVYVSRAGTSPDPDSARWRRLSTAEAHTPLVAYLPRVKVKATKNLLSGEFKDNVDTAAALELNANPTELAPHWKGCAECGSNHRLADQPTLLLTSRPAHPATH